MLDKLQTFTDFRGRRVSACLITTYLICVCWCSHQSEVAAMERSSQLELKASVVSLHAFNVVARRYAY